MKRFMATFLSVFCTTALFSNERTYNYVTVGPVVTNTPALGLFPDPRISGLDIGIGKRIIEGKHGWDFHAGIAGKKRNPGGYLNALYLFYPKEEGFYAGMGLGLYGIYGKNASINPAVPLTLGYELKRSFFQAEIQPNGLKGKTNGMSLTYGTMF